MSRQRQHNSPYPRSGRIANSPRLPPWLAARILRRGERIVRVYGPWFTPRWERLVTHPLLFLIALFIASAAIAVAWIFTENFSAIPVAVYASAAGLVLMSVFVLGIFSGYFTRLVVTHDRIIIVQGREVCRNWVMRDLPPELVRHRRMEDGEAQQTLDLDAIESMLGGGSDQFSDSKTILTFGKQLERIKNRNIPRTE